jgi:CRISPR-associated protein Cst2
MAHLTGIYLIDAPASALNNAGFVKQGRADNVTEVKKIKTPMGMLPYVSAQAQRYWLRATLAEDKSWTASPVFREDKIAYTDADPVSYAEDDLFGYMRASSKGTDSKTAAGRAAVSARGATAVDKDTTLTRVSPLKIGTAVATVPTNITRDWGTMARIQDGDPVPFEHEFYRAHLLAPWAIDLTAVGTFFTSKRTGSLNLDSVRIERAKEAKATEVEVRGQKAWRLPHEVRVARVASVLRALGRLDGGAKHTLHLTDTAPALCVFAVLEHGNQVFQRLVGSRDGEHTCFRLDVLDEVLSVHGDSLRSDVYVGWARGLLEGERAALEDWLKDPSNLRGKRVHLGHPRALLEAFIDEMYKPENESWMR